MIEDQQRAMKKIEFENSVLHEGPKVSHVGSLTSEGSRRPISSLVMEFIIKYHTKPRYPVRAGSKYNSQ